MHFTSLPIECAWITLADMFLYKLPARQTFSASVAWIQYFKTDDSYQETMNI